MVEAEEARTATSREFSAYTPPLEMVTYLKHLGRVISAADDEWPTVARNILEMQNMWQRMSRILIKEGARPQVSGFFFKSAVQ